MKTKKLIAILSLIISGGFFMDLPAQETLKALVKKCENMNDVQVSIVRDKDKSTRKVRQVITSISFKNNPGLVKEILNAFEKDKDMADQEIENRSNGRINLFYQFGSTSYSFSEGGEESASLSVIEQGSGQPTE